MTETLVHLIPRIIEAPALTIAGTRAHYTAATKHGMAAQWQRLIARLDRIPGRIGRIAWGVVANMSDAGVDYLAGVEVAETAAVTGDLVIVSVPAQHYAAFNHDGTVAEIGATMHAIAQWFPRSGLERASGGAADLLERYGEKFDPRAARGDIQLWVPIRR
jgi:AraC family transcriptional regulator